MKSKARWIQWNLDILKFGHTEILSNSTIFLRLRNDFFHKVFQTIVSSCIGGRRLYSMCRQGTGVPLFGEFLLSGKFLYNMSPFCGRNLAYIRITFFTDTEFCSVVGKSCADSGRFIAFLAHDLDIGHCDRHLHRKHTATWISPATPHGFLDDVHSLHRNFAVLLIDGKYPITLLASRSLVSACTRQYHYLVVFINSHGF